jgi:hypothetical protein
MSSPSSDTDRDVDLDEDALARAQLGGVDRVGDVAFGDPGQAPRAAGVVEHLAVLDDVGDAVLEQDEHVGAVIDAESVTGAEVLVDPHTHGDRTVPLAAYIGSTVIEEAEQTSDTPTAPSAPHRRRRAGPHVARARPATSTTRTPGCATSTTPH